MTIVTCGKVVLARRPGLVRQLDGYDHEVMRFY